MDHVSKNDAYYRKLANPICTLSHAQRNMMGEFTRGLDRQTKSRETRLKILAAKRGRTAYSDVSDSESVSTDISEFMSPVGAFTTGRRSMDPSPLAPVTPVESED